MLLLLGQPYFVSTHNLKSQYLNTIMSERVTVIPEQSSKDCAAEASSVFDKITLRIGEIDHYQPHQ